VTALGRLPSTHAQHWGQQDSSTAISNTHLACSHSTSAHWLCLHLHGHDCLILLQLSHAAGASSVLDAPPQPPS
jgi:hypothetical protein